MGMKIIVAYEREKIRRIKKLPKKQVECLPSNATYEQNFIRGNPAEAMSIIDRICVMFISIAMRGSEQKKHLNRAENLNLNKNSLSSFPKWA